MISRLSKTGLPGSGNLTFITFNSIICTSGSYFPSPGVFHSSFTQPCSRFVLFKQVHQKMKAVVLQNQSDIACIPVEIPFQSWLIEATVLFRGTRDPGGVMINQEDKYQKFNHLFACSTLPEGLHQSGLSGATPEWICCVKAGATTLSRYGTAEAQLPVQIQSQRKKIIKMSDPANQRWLSSGNRFSVNLMPG